MAAVLDNDNSSYNYPLISHSYITIMPEKTTSVSAEDNDVWLMFQTEIFFIFH